MARNRARILVFSGSLRSGSFSTALAALAVQTLALSDTEVTRISLGDYPLPLFDADLETEAGVPEAARALHGLMTAHAGIFVATPEYNASMPPLLINALDWVSRVRPGGTEQASAFRDRVWAVGSASPRPHGGLRAAMHLRQMLELGLGATVLPDQITVSCAGEAFTADGSLADDRSAAQLRTVLARLAGEADRWSDR